MQQSPNYYQPTYTQPLYQQNYSQPAALGQNPYMDRMNQLQQYQQAMQQQYQQPMQPAAPQQGLIGKPVNDFSEIKADDVPMNGTPAIFVKADLSEIEVRVWGKDGLIRPTTYKPILEQKEAGQSNMPQMDFGGLNEDVRALREEIVERFDRLEQSMVTPAAKIGSRSKKGEADNE